MGTSDPGPASEPSGLSFEAQAYKYLMLLGFVGEDNVTGQNLVGDRGGIQIVLDYLSFFAGNKTYVKWCCWTLIVSSEPVLVLVSVLRM